MKAFKDICAAARAGDKRRLELLYKEHKTLNIRMGLTTPTEVLASGGDVSIDEADVITDESIARAVESNIRAVRLLFEFSRKKGFSFDMLGACRGAAVVSEASFDAVWALLEKKFSRYELRVGRSLLRAGALQGAAMAGNFDLVDRFELSTDEEFNHVIIGAAQGEQLTYVRRHPGHVAAKLLGAARRGNADFVKELIQGAAEKGGAAAVAATTTARPYEVYIDEAVCGAASAGHVGLVRYLIGLGAKKDRAVLYAAEGGHFALVRELIGEGASADEAAHGAVLGGHFVFACELVQDYGASEDEATVAAAIKGEPYLEKALQEAFSRKPEAVSVADADDRTSLFSRSAAGQGLRTYYGTMSDDNGGSDQIEMTGTGAPATATATSTAVTAGRAVVNAALVGSAFLTNNPAAVLRAIGRRSTEADCADREAPSLPDVGRPG